MRADHTLAKGAGVFFFCFRGKHRSAAVVAAYIVRNTSLSATGAMAKIQEATRRQRGMKSMARFHNEWQPGDFPPLMPLVMAAQNWRGAPFNMPETPPEH